MLELLATVLALVASWRIFQKMGRQGWEGIVPIYSAYVMMQELYGNGWRVLLFLIPIYNIYLIFKVYIDLANRFHLGAGFGVGLALVYPIFGLLLAFGNYTYGDGSRATKGSDPISETIDSAANFVSDAFAGKASKRDPDALDKLEKLKKLRDSGVLSEEEYQKMKADLKERI